MTTKTKVLRYLESYNYVENHPTFHTGVSIPVEISATETWKRPFSNYLCHFLNIHAFDSQPKSFLSAVWLLKHLRRRFVDMYGFQNGVSLLGKLYADKESGEGLFEELAEEMRLQMLAEMHNYVKHTPLKTLLEHAELSKPLT